MPSSRRFVEDKLKIVRFSQIIRIAESSSQTVFHRCCSARLRNRRVEGNPPYIICFFLNGPMWASVPSGIVQKNQLCIKLLFPRIFFIRDIDSPVTYHIIFINAVKGIFTVTIIFCNINNCRSHPLCILFNSACHNTLFNF